MATIVELRTWLSEAESAYRDLMLGKAVVSVRDSNGEAVTFSTANASRLKLYIADLKSQIAGQPTSPHRVFRPVYG